MKKNLLLPAMLMILALAIMPFVFAAPTAGVVTKGSSTGSTGSTVADAFNVTGGNTTEVNITTTGTTDNWAGVFGNLGANLVLGTYGGNVFYEWAVTTSMTNATIYFANDTVGTWTLTPATSAVMPADVNGTDSDSFDNTFSDTRTFNSTSMGVANVPYVQTYNSSGTNGTLYTYALQSVADSAFIMAGTAVNDGDAFDGSVVDYQVLLPTNDGALQQYYAYLELP